jgi:hypothetical protein
MKLTLREWQKTVKPKEEILYNCSEFQHLNDEWVPFSIGMQYQIINFKGQDLTRFQIGNHQGTVFCAITMTTDERRRGHLPINRRNIAHTLYKNGINNTLVDPITYFHILPFYKFVISPEGNGIDCHRHYEAIMAGAIPIVEDNELIREKYKGCPILYTKDYSEINEVYLLNTYEKMLDETYDFSPVLLSSYSSTYQDQIRENGNYWAQRLTGQNWYD